MLTRFALASLIPLGAVRAQTQTVPVDHEAKHHLAFSNEWTRVFDVVVPPGDSTLYHVHGNDYVYVTFGPAGLSAQPLGGAAAPLNLTNGEVRFTRATITHRVVNPSATPFHNLTIEVLKTAGLRDSAPDGAVVVLDNERVRAERVVLEPGQSTVRHSHGGVGLDVAVAAGEVEVTDARGGHDHLTFKVGGFRWNDGPRTHTLTNIGQTRIEIVEIDWK